MTLHRDDLGSQGIIVRNLGGIHGHAVKAKGMYITVVIDALGTVDHRTTAQGGLADISRNANGGGNQLGAHPQRELDLARLKADIALLLLGVGLIGGESAVSRNSL